MDVHRNAKVAPLGRRLMVQRPADGWSVPRVAAASGVTAKTVRKWRDRFAAEGAAGLVDRSSRPHRSPARLGETAEAGILALRRHRLGRLSALDPKPEIVRHRRDRPGELIHPDVEKLGRIDGVGHRVTGDRAARSRGVGRGSLLHVCVVVPVSGVAAGQIPSSPTRSRVRATRQAS
jgi:transposase-like protein